jgi:hypothetical protein
MSAVNNGSYGRTEGGRFASGSLFASENPNHKKMHELRKALLDATTPERVKAVAEKMAVLAEAGIPPSRQPLWSSGVSGSTASCVMSPSGRVHLEGRVKTGDHSRKEAEPPSGR